VTRVWVPRPRARTWLVIAGVLVSGVSLWLALRQVSLADVWESLADAHWIWAIPSLVLIYVTLIIRAIRWRYLFVHPEHVPTWESAKAINVGLLFNNVLPSRAGEIPRIIALGRTTGISKIEIGSTVVVERSLDVVTVAAAGLAIWPLLPDEGWIDALCIVCAAIVVGFVIAAVVVVLFRRRARALAEAILRRLPFVSDEQAVTTAASLARGAHILANPRRFLLAVVGSILAWAAVTLSILVLLPAFDLPVSLTVALLVMVASSLALTVPSTSGAIGVYEAAAQFSLIAFGVDASTALSFALVLHALNLIPLSITGAFAAWATLFRRRD
jgi:glycosyltransferase 2 family protein